MTTPAPSLPSPSRHCGICLGSGSVRLHPRSVTTPTPRTIWSFPAITWARIGFASADASPRGTVFEVVPCPACTHRSPLDLEREERVIVEPPREHLKRRRS